MTYARQGSPTPAATPSGFAVKAKANKTKAIRQGTKSTYTTMACSCLPPQIKTDKGWVSAGMSGPEQELEGKYLHAHALPNALSEQTLPHVQRTSGRNVEKASEGLTAARMW